MYRILLRIVDIFIIIHFLYLGWVLYDYNSFLQSEVKYKSVYHPNYNRGKVYDNTGYNQEYGYDYARDFQYHQQQKFKEDERKQRSKSRSYSNSYFENNNDNDKEHNIPQCFIELGFDNIPDSEKKVKEKYRQLAKIYHPDLNDGNDIKFKEINKYYNEALKYFK